MTEAEVRYLTANLRVPCRPAFRDVEGLPLNTVFRDLAACGKFQARPEFGRAA